MTENCALNLLSVGFSEANIEWLKQNNEIEIQLSLVICEK